MEAKNNERNNKRNIINFLGKFYIFSFISNFYSNRGTTFYNSYNIQTTPNCFRSNNHNTSFYYNSYGSACDNLWRENIMKEKKYIEITELPNFEIEADISVGEKLGRSKFVLLPYEHLSDVPLADVVEVVHGKWEYDHWCEFKCSICGHQSQSEPRGKENFCPNCGAKMDGGKQ